MPGSGEMSESTLFLFVARQPEKAKPTWMDFLPISELEYAEREEQVRQTTEKEFVSCVFRKNASPVSIASTIKEGLKSSQVAHKVLSLLHATFTETNIDAYCVSLK